MVNNVPRAPLFQLPVELKTLIRRIAGLAGDRGLIIGKNPLHLLKFCDLI